jgi:hypothetical protein
MPLLAFFLAGCFFNTAKIRSPRGGTNAEAAKFEPVHDIPIPANSNLDHDKSLVLSTKEQWIGRMVLDVESSMAKVFSYYASHMAGLGWEPVSSILAENSVLTFVRGERVATVQIVPGTLSGSVVTVTMTPRQPPDLAGAERALQNNSVQADRLPGSRNAIVDAQGRPLDSSRASDSTPPARQLGSSRKTRWIQR